MKKPHLSILNEELAVCRLAADAPIPVWAAGRFFNITRTHEELSIVCVQDQAPKDVQAERGWRAFKVAGPLDFSWTGILAGLAQTLAQAEISLFAISTYDTDYILVRAHDLDDAVKALRGAGYILSEQEGAK